MRTRVGRLRRLISEELASRDPFPSGHSIGDIAVLSGEVDDALEALSRALRGSKKFQKAAGLCSHAQEDLKAIEALVMLALRR